MDIADKMITLARAKELVSYDPSTGVFVRNGWANGCSKESAGMPAGYIDNGYVKFNLDGTTYKAHRLAWFMTHGVWPTEQIDHINQVRSDNRICNLREANHSKNKMNHGARADNLTGVRGVSWNKRDKKYNVRIQVGEKRLWLGSFRDLELASFVYECAADRYFGEFNYRHAEAA